MKDNYMLIGIFRYISFTHSDPTFPIQWGVEEATGGQLLTIDQENTVVQYNIQMTLTLPLFSSIQYTNKTNPPSVQYRSNVLLEFICQLVRDPTTILKLNQ